MFSKLQNKTLIKYFIALLALCAVLILFSACTSTKEPPDNSVISPEPQPQPQETYYSVTYIASKGGTIEGKSEQTVKEGENAEEVTAVPDEGYKFVGWSDDLYSETRHDTEITADKTVTAMFTKLVFTVEYSLTKGGFISGIKNQQVPYGYDATEVTVIPDTGYYFVGWSDGIMTATRRDTNVTAPISVTAEFELISYTVKYQALKGGTIIGNTEQQVKHGENSEPVSAVPDIGYMFVGWSDGWDGWADNAPKAMRFDVNVTEDITVTAKFDVLVKSYALNYMFIAEGSQKTDITLTYGMLDGVTFPTPTKERYKFVGWFTDEAQITDESGNLLVGDELFYYDDTEFYAKWTAEPQFTYKILLVYVTEINGTFKETRGYRRITINYKMSEVERQICHNFTVKLQKKLNYMLDGLVYFQVDEYYTTRTMTEDLFMPSSDDLEYKLPAHRIPEIKEQNLLLQYQSFLTIVTMHDYEDGNPAKPSLLNKVAGSASEKYGTVYFDSIVRQALVDGDPLESFTDPDYWRWDNPLASPLEAFIHELIHTMETNIKDSNSVYPFHSFIAAHHEDTLKYGDFKVYKMYLLNEVIIDGVKVGGIPYEFWAGEMDLVIPWK